MFQSNAENITHLASVASRGPTPYDDELSDSDASDECKAQSMAAIHLTGAIFGLQAARAIAATGYSRDLLDDQIAALTDMLSDARGWAGETAEAVANTRGGRR